MDLPAQKSDLIVPFAKTSPTRSAYSGSSRSANFVIVVRRTRSTLPTGWMLAIIRR